MHFVDTYFSEFSIFVLGPISKNLPDHFTSIPDVISPADIELSNRPGMLKIACGLLELQWKADGPSKFRYFGNFQAHNAMILNADWRYSLVNITQLLDQMTISNRNNAEKSSRPLRTTIAPLQWNL